MKLLLFKEGPMQLLIPTTALKPPYKGDVFFNPRMAENRAFSSLALGACLPMLEGRDVLDGFCGCGARGIRYSLENTLKRIVFLDANAQAITLTKKNVKINNVLRAEFFEGLFEEFDEQMDWVEVDPFGTPAPFLEQAVELAKEKTVLSVTATDLATLCGRNTKPAEKRYGAKPLYVEYAHELAVRIVLGKIAREAKKRRYGIMPLFSFYRDHYVKTFVLLEKSEGMNALGFVSHCFRCGNRIVGKKKRCECGGTFAHAGPLWMRPLSELTVLKRMKERAGNEKRLFLEKLKRENEMPPYFFDAHKMAKRYGGKLKPLEKYLEPLRRKGCIAERTHYTPTGFKTNAPYSVVQALFTA